MGDAQEPFLFRSADPGRAFFLREFLLPGCFDTDRMVEFTYIQ